MSIVLQSTSGGSVTINEPTTASNFTQTLPASTGEVLLSSTTGMCKAWVNFNGTGTVAIRDSFNVSSITDNGTGDYTINFTTAMPNANYCVVGICDRNYNTENGTMVNQNSLTAPTTTAVRVCTFRVSTGAVDSSQMLFSVFSS
jgi:hypothetical protein